MTEHDSAPVSITSARTSRSEDMRKRQMRYLISMGIRTICFVLAIVTDGPVRWVLVAAAVFLPYVAVILANAKDQRSQAGPASFAPEERPRLEDGQPGPLSERPSDPTDRAQRSSGPSAPPRPGHRA